MRATFLFSATILCLAGPAVAGPLSVRIVDAAGRPVARTVVTVRPSTGGRPMKLGAGYSVTQKDLEFHPFVLVVPQGATVSFPNLDSTKHHVYSFSPAKKFELRLFARDQSRSVRFDKAGVVALGCNIHDSMSAFIVVADSAWTAVTDARGIVRFSDVPAAPASVTVWHPYLRAPANQIVLPLAAGETSKAVAVRLRPPPVHDRGGY